MKTHIFITEPQKEYALIDSGDGMKLERYGDEKKGIRIARPDPQALWRKSLSDKEWKRVDAYFADTNIKSEASNSSEKNKNDGSKWIMIRPNLPESWPIHFGDLDFNIKLTSFKHTGIFPEQHNNWLWCREIIKNAVACTPTDSVKEKQKPTVLNLFGYTGGASISAALGGAEVTHVDASRSSITWANDNAKSSKLHDAPIRWILDDALAFVNREVRRGKKYDAIIMDPPAFGRGAKGEIWKIEEHFLELFEASLKLLSDNPLFVVVNGYAAGYSAIAYENNMQKIVEMYGGEIQSGELAIREEGPLKRLLPCGIVSRWKK